MKKTVLFIAALFTLAANAIAHPVTEAFASKVAARFWAAHRPADLSADVTPKALSHPELDQLHIFDMEGLGFVIVAADDRVMPVLAYSFEKPFPSELNPELSYWLHGYNAQIAEMAKDDNYPQRESILQQWGKLALAEVLTDVGAETPSDLTSIPAMLTTHWNQTNPYNKLCPYDSSRNERTVVGCVATAMAQIMKYWNYPSCGEGSHSYTPQPGHSNYDFGVLSADFGNTTYLWQFMPDELDFVSRTYERNAVATLSYHCGVAVDMMYGSSSGAYSYCGDWATACATNAFWQYFKYDTSLFFAKRNDYSDSAWCALIDGYLAQGIPMYYDGSDSTGGHAFVLDGADTAGRYHFNWGWGGYGDGFYTIDNLAPGSGGAGGNVTYTFNNNQGAIFGIRPRMVEVFDTVDYYDSTCANVQYINFHEYELRTTEMDTLLRHLDTVFNYHLSIVPTLVVMLNANGPDQYPERKVFCPVTGYTFPECPFNNPGSIFIGWCHSKTGDDTIYMPGQNIRLNESRSFFALWIDTTSSAGIQNLDNTGNITLWPNPTSGELFISLSEAHNAQIFVINAMGHTVLRENYPNVTGGTAKISLQGLPAGTFTVQIKTPVGIYNQRIIKL